VHFLSRPDADQPQGTMHGLGRALFGDYLFAVELAGTLLLIASVGAIAMAPRREQGTL
jgi:NADH-quinone oxidoreductase subunit J